MTVEITLLKGDNLQFDFPAISTYQLPELMLIVERLGAQS